MRDEQLIKNMTRKFTREIILKLKTKNSPKKKIRIKKNEKKHNRFRDQSRYYCCFLKFKLCVVQSYIRIHSNRLTD